MQLTLASCIDLASRASCRPLLVEGQLLDWGSGGRKVKKEETRATG